MASSNLTFNIVLTKEAEALKEQLKDLLDKYNKLAKEERLIDLIKEVK